MKNTHYKNGCFLNLLCDLTQMEWLGLSSISMYGSQGGYTIVNFLLLYIVGACIRKCQFKIKDYSKKKYAFILLACVIILIFWSYVNDYFGYMFIKSAYAYCNPVIITEAVTVFLLFEKIDIKNNVVINTLSKAGFTVFLLNHYFFSYLKIGEFVEKNALIMLAHIFVSCIIIYFVSFIVYIIYSEITNWIYRLLYRYLKFPTIQLQDDWGEKNEQS